VTTIEAQADVMPAILDLAPVDPTIEITTVEQLVNHLRQAAYLEMSTIPMYLYAAFSVASKGYSQWDPGMGSFRLIRSVVVEEMLHLSLVRNLLVALGAKDKAKFYDPAFIPKYPSLMLHRYPDLMLHLDRCSPELARNVFMEFERPKAKPGEKPKKKGQYLTIGQFYRAVGKGLEKLDKKLGKKLWAHNDPSVQYVAAYWNKDGGGEPVLVRDLKSAQDALKIIIEQGEGIDPDKPTVPIDPLKPIPGLDELPHYTKFKRIADEVEKLGSIWVVPRDPKAADYQHDEAVSSINELFNAVYCYVLHMLDVIYETPWDDVEPGKHSARYGMERTLMSAMQGVLVSVAEIMVATQVQPKAGDTERVQAGPTFQYVELPEHDKVLHLKGLCEQAMRYFPQLGGDNSVHWLLGKLPEFAPSAGGRSGRSGQRVR
jgi:hypothetical protein